MGQEQRTKAWQQWQGSASGLCLHRARLNFAADALELLADVEDVVREVDVTPAEADGFSAAQPVEQEQPEGWLPLVTASLVEEPGGFFCVPGADVLRLIGGQFDQTSDIANDQFFTHGTRQGRRKYLANLLNDAWAYTRLGHIVDGVLDVADREKAEPPASQSRTDEPPDDALVTFVGSGPSLDADDTYQPAIEPVSEAPRVNRGWNALMVSGEKYVELLTYLSAALSIDANAALASDGGTHEGEPLKAAIFPERDGSGAP